MKKPAGKESTTFQITLLDTPFRVSVDSLREKPRTLCTEERHTNAGYELHIVLTGSCTFGLDTEKHVLNPGDGVFIPPGLFHHSKKNGKNFSKFCCNFRIEQGALSETLQKTLCESGPFLHFNASVLNLCQKMHQESEDHSPFYRDYIQAKLSELLILVFRKINLISKEQWIPQNPEDTVTAIIDNFFCFVESGSEKDLANQLHFSVRQLSRILQKHYGKTFREKLIDARMDHAAYLLKSTSLSVNDISQKVGYRSVGTFFKTFQHYYGLTPRKYRIEKRDR